MYKMFLDESGDHNLKSIDPDYPVLSLVGLIIEEKYYEEKCVKRINEIKLKYFDTTEIILHSYDIRKQKGPFAILRNECIRKNFYADMDNLFNELSFNIIATVIDKAKLKEKYSKPTNPYNLSLKFILERYVMYLNKKDDSGVMIFESRDKKSNDLLDQDFLKCFINGTGYVKSIEFQSRIYDLTFISKEQNEIGLQLADLVAYPVATFLLPNRDKRAFEMLRPKFISSKSGKIDGYGFKVFP